MAFYVYILRCCDNSYYTGHTDNIEKRLVEHKEKQYEGYTSARLPVELVFLQKFETRAEALEIEWKVKKWSKKKKEALISNNWLLLSELAQRKKA